MTVYNKNYLSWNNFVFKEFRNKLIFLEFIKLILNESELNLNIKMKNFYVICKLVNCEWVSES